MPLDGTGFRGNGRLEKIDAVIGLLADERRWCQGKLVSEDGKRCILGAIQAAGAVGELERPILLAIKQVTGHRYHRIESFNDARSTSHALVVQVLYRARDNILNEVAELMPGGATPAPRWWSAPVAFLSRLRDSFR